MPKISMKKEVQVQAKTLKIHIKVCDQFTASLCDQDGTEIHEQEDGYVPHFMPGEHYGDYLILDIDLDTGKILNWKVPTDQDIEAWLEPEK